MTTIQETMFQQFFSFIETYENDERLLEDIDLGNVEDDDPRLEDIETLNKVREFIEDVYEIAFGDDAINRGFTTTDVIDQLKELSDNYAENIS
tara:strand:- start:278 stop:556 length:279 start_codon:yes stop_codon:yes gene_type:complete